MTSYQQFSHSAARTVEQVRLADALAEAQLSREDDPLEHDDLFPLYITTFCSVLVAVLVLFS